MKANQDCLTLRASVAAVCGALLALTLVPVAQSADTGTDTPAQETTTPAASATDAGVNKPAPAENTEEASENAELIEQTRPTNYVEVGAGYVNKNSYKFGEYNGLEKKGPYGVGNIDLRGGGTYDSDNAQRWRVTGTDLGLETRDVTAEYGEQGRFRVNFGYDELTRNRSDSYQTPYFGAGSNHLYLPPNWLVPVLPQVSATVPNARVLSPTVAQSNSLVSGVSTPPSAGQRTTSNGIIAADVPDFRDYHLDTKRAKTNLGFGLTFTPQWEFKTSFSHEDKNGAKPMGTVSRAVVGGGDISTIIPDPIDQTTDQFSASLNYTAEKGFMQAAYYGSLFHNHIPSVTWQNWAGPTNFATMSSAPSNEFHQINLTGGYNFSRTTKLVVNGSYARSTQNQSFLTDASTPVVPASSLEGLVVNQAFNVKLTTRPTNDLNLSAGYKFDDRNNRTPVNIYQYADASEVASANTANFPAGPNNPYGAVVAQNANANRPYSKRLNQIDLGADWRVANSQWIKGDYQFQKIDRSCNGTWIDCADAADSKENTLGAEYRNSVLENVNGRIGYARSKRTVGDYNEDAFLALVPYANVIPANGTMSAYQFMKLMGWTGYGPVAGYIDTTLLPTPPNPNYNLFFPSNIALANNLYVNNNRISELIGMRRYNMADRNRDKLRSSIDWQATEQLSLQAGIDYNKDDYANSVYGLQEAKSWALNLDGTYAASQDFSVTIFYTFEDQRSQSAGNTYVANTNATTVGGVSGLSGNSGCDPYTTLQQRNNNNKIDPCANWSADMRDKVDTLGFEFQKKNFFSRKFDLVGDLVFTRARSDNDVSGGNWVNNPHAGVAGDTIAAYFIPATALPTVTTDTIELRLNGSYKIDKASTMRVGYTYARLKSTDWAYDGMQYGGLTGVLPTNEQAPNYSVNVIVVGYQYIWR